MNSQWVANLRILLISIFTVIISTAHSYASCECACVNGKVEAICTMANEIKPYCASRICPAALPSLAPAMQENLPPSGKTSCEMKQVYNEIAKKYEWKRICI